MLRRKPKPLGKIRKTTVYIYIWYIYGICYIYICCQDLLLRLASTRCWGSAKQISNVASTRRHVSKPWIQLYLLGRKNGYLFRMYLICILPDGHPDENPRYIIPLVTSSYLFWAMISGVTFSGCFWHPDGQMKIHGRPSTSPWWRTCEKYICYHVVRNSKKKTALQNAWQQRFVFLLHFNTHDVLHMRKAMFLVRSSAKARESKLQTHGCRERNNYHENFAKGMASPKDIFHWLGWLCPVAIQISLAATFLFGLFENIFHENLQSKAQGFGSQKLDPVVWSFKGFQNSHLFQESWQIFMNLGISLKLFIATYNSGIKKETICQSTYG